jgi:hypothetical protein
MLLSPKDTFRPDSAGRIKLRWESFAYLPPETMEALYTSKEPLEVPLNECDIIGHDGLLWLLSISRWRKATGTGPTYIQLPRDPKAVSLISDLNFPIRLIDSGAQIVNQSVLWASNYGGEAQSGAPRRRPRPLSPRYIQLINSSNWSNVFDAVDTYFVKDVSELLHQSPHDQLISEEALPFRKAIGELIINVARHGGSSEGGGIGYVCYRPWARRYPLLRFCCNDLGPGFATTLARHSDLRPASETEAVFQALLYRHSRPEEGVLGLYRALPFIHSLRGRLHIRSVDASVTLDLSEASASAKFEAGYEHPTQEWVRSISKTRTAGKVRGCHIALDLHLPQTPAERRMDESH